MAEPSATRTALVTGAAGQDGSYLLERLLADGWRVHALVRQGDVPRPAAPGAPGELVVSRVDLRDGPALARTVAASGAELVVNLGGVSSVARSWQDPVEVAEASGSAVAHLLAGVTELERGGVPVRVVQASSAEVFGSPQQVPQDEATPLAPTSPYGAAKAFAHHLVQAHRARGGFGVNVVLYNHESPRRPTSFVTRKITAGAAAVAAGRAEHLVLGSLDVARDWGWAPDYVDALLRAGLHDEPGDYVVATGTAHTVAEFAAAALARVGVQDWRATVRTDPSLVRPVDAPVLVGDASRARRVLGWRPTVDFDELVGRMVDHDVELLRRSPA